jgi:hypothetical protein
MQIAECGFLNAKIARRSNTEFAEVSQRTQRRGESLIRFTEGNQENEERRR